MSLPELIAGSDNPWRCAGCGKKADGLIKTCDCPTMVGRRDRDSTWLVTRQQEEKDRLTAAAPSMLTALHAAECAVAELCHGQDPAYQCWVILAEVRAAIAKAEGGQS